ncbi:MAG: helix-turn-helix transcriptional regulator [Pseudomonadota bacterium]
MSDEFCGATVYLGHEQRNSLLVGDTWTALFDHDVWRDLPTAWLTPERNIVVRSMLAFPVARAFDRRSLVDDSQFDSNLAMRTVLGQQGLFHCVFTPAWKDDDILSGMWLARAINKGPIERGEFARYQAISTHVSHAMRVHRMLGIERERAASCEAMLNRLAQGAILINAKRKILFANEAAERILADGAGIGTRAGQLRLQSGDLDNQLLAGLGKLIELQKSRISLTVPRIKPGPDYSMSIYMVPSGLPLGHHPASPQIMVFIADPASKGAAASAPWLKSHFGLTEREATVAQMAADGLRAGHIADINGVSRNTIKTQLAAVYSKLGVSSQSDLIRLATAVTPS